MTVTETKLATLGSKRVVEPQVVNAVISQQPEKRTKFQIVAAGVCPHDNTKLEDEIRGSGVGVTRVCEICGHTWYLNKKIRTCKCLACSGAKRNSKEQTIANRRINSSTKKAGGRFWIRTRDPSLIRTVL